MPVIQKKQRGLVPRSLAYGHAEIPGYRKHDPQWLQAANVFDVQREPIWDFLAARTAQRASSNVIWLGADPTLTVEGAEHRG